LPLSVAAAITDISALNVQPGELPESMPAWLSRPARAPEPIDAFQLEQVAVPEPGPFEVTVRVMAAGVNYNNVWAALGQPVSVFGFGDHPEYGHHIGGSDGAGIVWKVGAGVTRWKPGDEVVVHCNQASYEDPEVHGLDPLAAPSQRIWGYETTWGSFAQFTKVQAQQLLRKPPALTWEEAASYGLVYFTAYRMLIDRCALKAGDRVLIWGAAGGLGVFATQLCAAAGAQCVGVVSSEQKGELVVKLGASGYIDRGEFAAMMRTGTETPEQERARSEEARRFSKRVREILGGAPDIVFEHVGRATFPTSVFVVKPFGKVVICAGTSGFNVDFDVRYLWMRQKQIIGSHFANAYECTRANELIEQHRIRPVLWRTFGFDGVAEAHQLMRDNRHLGKIAILVGAAQEGTGKTAEGPGAIRAEVGI
jgi:crotonyl-CoA carboxylase/reductase